MAIITLNTYSDGTVHIVTDSREQLGAIVAHATTLAHRVTVEQRITPPCGTWEVTFDRAEATEHDLAAFFKITG